MLVYQITVEQEGKILYDEKSCVHLLCKITTIGANGRFNISSLQQTQSSTGNLEAKACTVSNSCLQYNHHEMEILTSDIQK
jgi:hypothetical protein